MVRVGLIGVGRHGRRYLQHLTQEDAPDLCLVGISCRNRSRGEEAAASAGTTYYPDPRTLIDDPSVDAILVVTPPSSHLELSLTALAAGKHVLVEKPVADSHAAALKLLSAPGNHLAMVAQTCRFDPLFATFLATVHELGQPRWLRIEYAKPDLSERLCQPVSPRTLLLEVGVHLTDLAAKAAPDGIGHKASLVHSTPLQVSARIEGGCPLELSISAAPSDPARFLLEAETPGGLLTLDRAAGALSLRKGGTLDALPVPEDKPALPPTLVAFAAFARGGSNPVPLSEGARALLLAEACCG